MTPEQIAKYYNSKALGSFSTALMDLIGKADLENRAKISMSFPEYVEAWNIWFRGEY